jgi:hypothetical protein
MEIDPWPEPRDPISIDAPPRSTSGRKEPSATDLNLMAWDGKKEFFERL